MSKVIIETCENGWIVKHFDGERWIKRICQEEYGLMADERKTECENYTKLLYDVLDIVGYNWSKHASYNIKFLVVPGYENENYDKEIKKIKKEL